MKGWRLRSWGVQELDADESEILRDDIEWTCLHLDAKHDIWVDDDALSTPGGVFVARVGQHGRVPLPAIVLGVDGERSVDATIDENELRDIFQVLTHTSLED
jgi:hypothetical protein